MGADQIAAIRPAIAELEEANRGSEGEFIARFDVPGHNQHWVEVVVGTVNLAYPFKDDPLTRLLSQEIAPLPELTLVEWQPELFATFRYDSAASSREVAKFVDRLFEALFNCGQDYEVDVMIERVAS